jgi:hypothetical protein
LLIGIALAHRLHLPFHYIPYNAESRLPEELNDNFSRVLLVERDFFVEGETLLEVEGETCLYIQGEAKETLPYPYVINNSHRVGFLFCSGVTEESMSVSVINIGRKLRLTGQSNIVMITDMRDDIALAFLLAAVYSRASINFIEQKTLAAYGKLKYR